MNKRMTISFAVSMTCLFLFLSLAAFAPRRSQCADLYGSLAALSCFLLFSSTVGVVLLNLALDVYIRHTDAPATGAVLYARPAGYVNHWPNWEPKLQLADGRVAKMEAVRLGLEPGELLHVVVGRGNPARATYPAKATKRRSF